MIEPEIHTITTEEEGLLIDKVYMRYTRPFIRLNLFPGDVVSFRATVTPMPPQKSLPLSKDNDYYRQPVRLTRPTKIRKLAGHAHPSVLQEAQKTALAFLAAEAREVQARTIFAQHIDSAFTAFRIKWQPFSDANNDRDSVEHCHPLSPETWRYVPWDEIERILATKSRQQFGIFAGVHIDLYDASAADALERHIGVRCRWSALSHPYFQPEWYADLPLRIPDWPQQWQYAFEDELDEYLGSEREIPPGEEWRAEQRVRQTYRTFIQERITATNARAKQLTIDLDALSQKLGLNLRTMAWTEARQFIAQIGPVPLSKQAAKRPWHHSHGGSTPKRPPRSQHYAKVDHALPKVVREGLRKYVFWYMKIYSRTGHES